MSGPGFNPGSTTSVLAGTYTLSPNTLPSASANARKYVWVSDLFGGPGDFCISDGASWKPVRPVALLAASSGTMTLTALMTAPTVLLTGTIGTGVTRTITLGTSFAYSGAKFRVCRKAGGLGTLLVNALGIALNSWADHEWDSAGSAWVQTASGGLL